MEIALVCVPDSLTLAMNELNYSMPLWMMNLQRDNYTSEAKEALSNSSITVQ